MYGVPVPGTTFTKTGNVGMMCTYDIPVCILYHNIGKILRKLYFPVGLRYPGSLLLWTGQYCPAVYVPLLAWPQWKCGIDRGVKFYERVLVVLMGVEFFPHDFGRIIALVPMEPWNPVIYYGIACSCTQSQNRQIFPNLAAIEKSKYETSNGLHLLAVKGLLDKIW